MKINEPEWGLRNPRHHLNMRQPCAWCGAEWRRDTNSTAFGMDHKTGCEYILFLDRLEPAEKIVRFRVRPRSIEQA